MANSPPPGATTQNRLLQGMMRGIAGKCPNCGEGRLYRAYLKVEPVCPSCGNDNARYRADDAGPYFTILVVGHLVVAPMLFFPFVWKAPIALVLCTTLPVVAVLTLVLLPVVKGAVIGALWAMQRGKAAAGSTSSP